MNEPSAKRQVNFTAKSLRLDTVVGSLFGFSRTKAAEAVKAGVVCINHTMCDKISADVKVGDIITFKNKFQGQITNIGGKSRKDRMFVEAQVWTEG